MMLRSQAGLNLYQTWDEESCVCILEESLSYVNKTPFNTNIHSAVIIAPSALPFGAPSSFSAQTYNEMLNLFNCGFEIFYKHKPSKFFFSVIYEGEFGSRFMSNDVQGTLGLFF